LTEFRVVQDFEVLHRGITDLRAAGIAVRDVKGKFYPAVGLKKAGEHIRVNFGQTPFVYDIDSMMKQEQAKIQKAISETRYAVTRCSSLVNEP
jgi:hypothetical protein